MSRLIIIIIRRNNVDTLKDHNHPKLPFIKAKIEIKEEMLKLSRETNIGLKEIFNSGGKIIYVMY